MGLYNRPYWKDSDHSSSSSWGGIGLPSFGRVVKVLLILNIAAYVLQLFLDQSTPANPFGWMKSVFAISASTWWQAWRYVTFQFLHGGTWHLLLNMLGLWVIGAPLERLWGGRKFLAFYLSCGAAAGVSYLVLSAFTPVLLYDVPLVGASGGVYGLLLAAAVLLPQMSLIFLFFPVPIRLAVIILGAIILLDLLSGFRGALGSNTFSQMAHFGGVVMGGAWLLAPRFRRGADGVGGMDDFATPSRGRRKKWNQGRWAAKREKEQDRELAEQAEVDRILEKISQHGLGSITRRERKILNDATTRQRQRDRENDREMRL